MKVIFIPLFLISVLLAPFVAFAQESADDGLFYFKRGQEYFKKMEYRKALLDYKRALRIEPRNEVFYKAVVDLCDRLNEQDERWVQMAAFYKNKGGYDKALHFYSKVLSTRQQDTEVLNSIGNIYTWKEEYKRALEYYNRSLRVKKNADAFLGRGDVYFFQNLLDKAQAEYEKALSIVPSHRLAHRRLGQIHEKGGEYGKALAEYRIVLKNKWNDSDAWIRAGWNYELGQDLENAQACYARAIEFEPGNLDALNGLGRIGVAQGRYDEAEKFFKEALHGSTGLKAIESLNGLGWLYAWQGDFQKARGYFFRALGADELNIEAKTGLGWLYSRKEEYDKALEWYKRAQQGKGVSLEVASSIGMAWVYTRKEEYARAIGFYKKILEESPKSTETYNGLGWLYLKTGDLNSASRFYEKSLSLRERNPDAHYGIAQIHEKRLEFDEAIKRYKIAIGYGTLNLSYRKALALCYLKNKEDEKALELLEELAQKGTADEEIWSRMASLQFQWGELDEAGEAYRHILLEINPESLVALSGLAEVYFAKKDYDRAVESYEKILAIDPDHRVARKGLATVYRWMGLYDKALREFNGLIATKYNDVESWNSLGWLYLRTQDYGKAIACYEKGLSFIEDNPDGLIGLSVVYLELIRRSPFKETRAGYFQRALWNCEKVLAEHPKYGDAYFCSSKLYLELGNPKEAGRVLADGLKVFKESLGKDPNDPYALQQDLGMSRTLLLLERKGEAEDGLKEADSKELAARYKRLLELKVNDADAWLGLASLYRMAKRYDRAQDVLERAMEFVDESRVSELKLSLAEVNILKGDLIRAEENYSALLRSGSAGKPRIYFGLGKICELKGNSNGAIRSYRKAMDERRRDGGGDDKEARLALARVLAKKGFLNQAIAAYLQGFDAPPLEAEYDLRACKYLGEIYLKMGFLTRAELFYKRVLDLNPGDFDSLMALAHIARFRGRYQEAVGRYEQLLSRNVENATIHRMLGNIHFWRRNWQESLKEYQLALESPDARKGMGELNPLKEMKRRQEVEKDLAKLRRASSSSLPTRFKYSESKEDDTGKGAYVISTKAWDAGFRYRQVVNNRVSLNGGFSYSPTREKNIRASQVDFDIVSDYKTVGFEYEPREDVEITGSYEGTGYHNGDLDAGSQRTPLRKSVEFQGYDVGVKYKAGRNSFNFSSSKEPLKVKIFTDDPELGFYSKYHFLLGLDSPVGDLVEIKGALGADTYSPSGIWKQLYEASAAWNFYRHNLMFFGKKEGFPLTSFQRSDGLRVLGVQSAGFSYANNWIEDVTLTASFKERYYSDKNRGGLAEAGAVWALPRLKGLNVGYGFSFEDHKVTAGAVGGEPLYRSPQDLAIHSFPVSYGSGLFEKWKYSLGYTFSRSSESRNGHAAFLKASYDLTEKTTLNLETERNDDASFARGQKYLVYLTTHFF